MSLDSETNMTRYGSQGDQTDVSFLRSLRLCSFFALTPRPYFRLGFSVPDGPCRVSPTHLAILYALQPFYSRAFRPLLIGQKKQGAI